MQFIKTLLASTLGVFLAFFILFLVTLIMVASSQRESEPFVRDGSVLHIELGGVLAERTSPDPFAEIFATGQRPTSLTEVRNNLRKAAADDRISGVWLDMNALSAPWSRLHELHSELERFKESGKFIYASTDDLGFTQQSYYLATVADSIFSPPLTFFQFEGMHIQGQFLKNMFDKIGVDFTVINTGDHKSAGDGFTRTSFSDADREQLQPIINQFANQFLSAVSNRSGLSRDELDTILNERPYFTIESVQDFNFFDAFAYPDEVKAKLEQRVKDEGHRRFNLVANHRYTRVKPESAGLDRMDNRNRIAVLHLNGPIEPMSDPVFPGSSQASITATNFYDDFESILDDESVKAVILHVNSPGGAASTSELIWAAIQNRDREIPVLTYMGSVAASGGYYIGMAADEVFANPSTITGSIGVISLWPNASELLNERLGITFDEITSHEHAGWLSPDRALSPAAERAFRDFNEETYEIFLDRVAASRAMDVEEIRPLAGGRVYTGLDAAEVGLIDGVGTLDDVIARAAELAELETWSIARFPQPKTFIETLLASSGTSVKGMFMRSNPALEQLHWIQSVIEGKRMQNLLIMPYDLILE